MAKYVEVPRKPQVVQAVQFIAMDNGVPVFNEKTPEWVFAAFARGLLSVVQDMVAIGGEPMPIGTWFMTENGTHVMWQDDKGFRADYKLARQRPGTRSKAQLSVAAE